MRGRRAHGDVNAVVGEGGEELGEAVFEARQHLAGVGCEKEPGQLAVNLGGDGLLLFEHDGVTVAAFGDRRGGRPTFGGFEDQDADRHGRGEIVFADNLAERMAELFQANDSVASHARAGVREDFVRARGKLHPMVLGDQE